MLDTSKRRITLRRALDFSYKQKHLKFSNCCTHFACYFYLLYEFLNSHQTLAAFRASSSHVISPADSFALKEYFVSLAIHQMFSLPYADWQKIRDIMQYLQLSLERIQYYYINTNEIPGELSRENMISSHVKITCYLHV